MKHEQHMKPTAAASQASQARARRWVARVLERLYQIQEQYYKQERQPDAWDIEHARIIVRHLQEYPHTADPYIATYAEMWRRSYKDHQALLAAAERSSPARDALPYVIEGRTGRQWALSIMAYLDFRSGRRWRPLADRFNPEYEIYLGAWRLVNAAQRDPAPAASFQFSVSGSQLKLNARAKAA